MIYEEYKKNNYSSEINIKNSTISLVYSVLFFDKKGLFHNHDKNETNITFKCSNVHEFSKKYSGRCWCGC